MIKQKQQSKIRVMATGVFDLLHPGHIYFLEEARKLGDKLVVLVANDKVVNRTKGEHLFDEMSRCKLVASLAVVDTAVIAKEIDPKRYYRSVLEVNPAILALGFDQKFDEVALEKELHCYGWQGKVVRIGKYPEQDISSSIVKKRLPS